MDDGDRDDLVPVLPRGARSAPGKVSDTDRPLLPGGPDPRTDRTTAPLAGWNSASRLARGREQLRGRLVRRGLALSVGLWKSVLAAETARAAIPAACECHRPCCGALRIGQIHHYGDCFEIGRLISGRSNERHDCDQDQVHRAGLQPDCQRGRRAGTTRREGTRDRGSAGNGPNSNGQAGSPGRLRDRPSTGI